MANPLLCVRLGDIDDLFHAWCQAQDVSPVDVLRDMVVDSLENPAQAELPSPKNKRIRINAGEAHGPFLDKCAHNKSSASAFIRKLALDALVRSQMKQMPVMGIKDGKDAPRPVAKTFAKDSSGALATEVIGDTDAERVRLTLRLSASEMTALTGVAQKSRASVQMLTVRLIRASLLGEGVLKTDESKHLGDINLALLRIGGNLNQIAKHLNAQPSTAAQLRHEELQKCVADINGYVRQAAQVLQSGRERWRIQLRGGSHE